MSGCLWRFRWRWRTIRGQAASRYIAGHRRWRGRDHAVLGPRRESPSAFPATLTPCEPALLEIKSSNPFRIRAYRRAAASLENLTDNIEMLARQGSIREISGIGEDLAKKIIEYVDTGKMVFFEDLKLEIPPALVKLVGIP